MSKAVDPYNIVRETNAAITNFSLDAKSILLTEPNTLGVPAATAAWSVIDRIEKELFKERKGDLRDYLMESASRSGTKDVKGSFILKLEDGEVKKEFRSGKVKFSLPKVLKLVSEKREAHPEIEQIVVRVPEVSEEGINRCLELGVISAEELSSISEIGKPTYALKVKKPSAVQEIPFRLKG